MTPPDPMRLEPQPLPVGGWNFAAEMTAAIIAEFEAAKDDLSIASVAELLPQLDAAKVQSLRRADFPAVLVRCAMQNPGATRRTMGCVEVVIALTFIIYTQDASATSADAAHDLARQKIVGLLGSSAFAGSRRFLPVTGFQADVQGFSLSPPTRPKRGPGDVWSLNVANVRVFAPDPGRG